jgi:hypothetical protein
MGYIFPANTIEGTIEREYVPAFGSEGEDSFRHCVKEAEGVPVAPPNYGDLIVQGAEENPELRSLVANLRKHGVRDQDIRWWYNKHPLEHKCVAFLHNSTRLAMWLTQQEKGVSAAEATINIYRHFPRIGNPDDPNWGGEVRPMLTEVDRPLPVELLGVIDKFLASHSNDATFLSRLSRSSSLNAFVREAIESGECYQDSAETPHSKAEAFFISKIQEGLSYSSANLASEDKYLLLTRMENVASLPGCLVMKYKQLEQKCVKAITEAYARDTDQNGLDAANIWRAHIDSVYKNSRLLISDIMQTWYLSVGRAQEVRAGQTEKEQSSGCLSVITFVVIGVLFFVAATILSAGVPKP